MITKHGARVALVVLALLGMEVFMLWLFLTIHIPRFQIESPGLVGVSWLIIVMYTFGILLIAGVSIWSGITGESWGSTHDRLMKKMEPKAKKDDPCNHK